MVMVVGPLGLLTWWVYVYIQVYIFQDRVYKIINRIINVYDEIKYSNISTFVIQWGQDEEKY